MPKLPNEMKRSGRQADQRFKRTEKLWRRFAPEDLLEHGMLDMSCIELPDTSVNREKHEGKPEFVLFPNFFQDGIAEFTVESIPTPLLKDGQTFQIIPHHAPLEENYHHTELRCLDPNNSHVDPLHHFTDVELRKWRHRFRNSVRIIREPNPSLAPMFRKTPNY